MILPINICEVVRASVMTAGCEPIFCDIDEGTLCINLSQAEEVLQKNTVNLQVKPQELSGAFYSQQLIRKKMS